MIRSCIQSKPLKYIAKDEEGEDVDDDDDYHHHYHHHHQQQSQCRLCRLRSCFEPFHSCLIVFLGRPKTSRFRAP